MRCCATPLTALAVGVAAAAVALGLAAAPAAAAGTASSERIAVSLATAQGGEGSGGLVLVDAAGRRVARLTARRAGRQDTEPAWSPDARRLAFTRTADGGRSFHVYVVRADGSGLRRLTAGRFDSTPAWSPDGRWIAYRADRQLRVIRADGSGGRTIPTRAPTDSGHPAWLSGDRIAYSYWPSVPQDWPAACHGSGSLCGWVVSSRLDGTDRRRVVRGRDAHWSPDGRAIVYTGPDGGVLTASAAGGSGRLLGRGHRAEWSRDGRRIVYARMGRQPAEDSVWVMDRDGSGPHRLLRGGSDPAWRP